MANRSMVDLSHFSFDAGEIGHLQTIAAIPIVAGDSVSVDLEGIWRLSPLRRNLVVDCQIDMFAFFVPHRHIYGEEWIDFIKEGKNATANFPPASTNVTIDYLGAHYSVDEEMPLWVPGGYNRIWNRYFRAPTDDVKIRADDYFANSVDERLHGFRCGYLPKPWSTGVYDGGVSETEREVPVVADTFDIVDLNRVQAEYRSEVDREYFGQRYNDLLNTVFGSTVNTDADERPTLCAHNSWWLSGYDVDGTADATLGSYSGKSAGIGKMGFRRKFFPEHGAMWIMTMARFPTIHVLERHFLASKVNPSYLEISGDPDLVAAEPPAPLLGNEFFRAATATDLGEGPYGQWYRYHPSHVHQLYEELDGFTFIDTRIDTIERSHYMTANEYDEVFQTTQLGHWQSHSSVGVHVNRVTTGPRSSLYAGG